jgi:hypothetical protein
MAMSLNYYSTAMKTNQPIEVEIAAKLRSIYLA